MPKKEVHDLLSEIINSCENLNCLNDFDALTLDWNLPKQAAFNVDDLNATLITPVKQIEETIATPETNPNQSKSRVVTASSSPPPSSPSSPGPSNISYFDPSTMSTPARVNDGDNQTSSTIEQPQKQSQFDSFDTTILAATTAPSPANDGSKLINQPFTYQYPTSNAIAIVSLESNVPILIPVSTYTANSNALQPFQTQYLPNSIEISSEAKTTTTTPSTVVSSFQLNENAMEIDRLNLQIQSEPVREKPGHRAKRSRFKSAAFKELENLDPNAIQPKVSGANIEMFFFINLKTVSISFSKYFYPIDERGFTPEQRQILDNQLRKHVQLASQSYIQTYGHPELYTEAYRIKRFLVKKIINLLFFGNSFLCTFILLRFR